MPRRDYLSKGEPGYEEAKAKAEQLLVQGGDPMAVAEETGLHPSTVYYLYRRLKEQGLKPSSDQEAFDEDLEAAEAAAEEEEKEAAQPAASSNPNGPWVFRHRHANARIVLESGSTEQIGGRQIIHKSRVVRFRNHVAVITDRKVAEELRQHPRYGIDFVESGQNIPPPVGIGEAIIRHYTSQWEV